MLQRVRHDIRRRAAAAALGAVLALGSGPASVALALPGSSAIESKKQERAAALDELERMEGELAVKVQDYVELGREMERVRGEAARVEVELDAMQADVERKQEAVSLRAVQLYRSDRVGMMTLLFAAESLPELMDRISYLVASTRRDGFLIQELRLAQQEALWLQEALDLQMARLSELAAEADRQAEQIEADMEVQQRRAAALGEDIARLLREQQARTFAGSEPTGQFQPDVVISDANFTNGAAMTAEEIQRFLDAQPGTLKSYRAKDHLGVEKTVAQMISEAAIYWRVSPMVILVTLQKEQSLLARTNPSQKAYDWAMGCGRADSRTYYEYQGFGKQIWWGAQKLQKNAKPWSEGITLKIDGSVVRPQNSSTYSLYKYTPHFKGTMSFWLLYWRYFGDPLAQPSIANP